MSKMIPLDPAVSIPCAPAELIATEAGRSDRGLTATIQIFNGDLKGFRLVKFAVEKDCKLFAETAAECTGVAESDVLAALPLLANAIESRLREPKKKRRHELKPAEPPLSESEIQEKYGDYTSWRSEGGIYLVENGRLYRVTFDKEGEEQRTPLSNFAAKISEETALDDGTNLLRYYTMEGRLFNGRPLSPGRIPVARFFSMSWPAELWGAGPSIVAGMGAKDHVRAATEEFSGVDVPRKTIFTYVGWRHTKEHGYVFLHAGGSVGGKDLSVELDPELETYRLPLEVEDVEEALRITLGILSVGDPKITYPLWAMIWRLPLCEWLPFLLVMWLLGESGTLKSSVAAVILSYFGGPFDKDHLPASWMDTDNRLEQKAFYAKDVPLVVDDYCPEKHPGMAHDLERRASRLIRSVGNRQGRGRLRADLTVRKAYFPRGGVIATAEQLPNVPPSAMARILPVPFEKEAIDKAKLLKIQERLNLLPRVTRSYLEWIRSQTDGLQERLRARFIELRAKARVTGHDRLPEAVAHLHLGVEWGIAFLLEVKALDDAGAGKILEEAWRVFMELAEEHARTIGEERPSLRFLAALTEALVGGRAWLADRETGKVVAGTSGSGCQKLGWVDKDGVYLLPGIAYEFAAERLRNRSGLVINEHALRKMLEKDGLLLHEANERLTSKPRCEGTPTRVLWLKRDALGELPGASTRRTKCHGCQTALSSDEVESCSNCGWLVCPNCDACDPECGGR